MACVNKGSRGLVEIVMGCLMCALFFFIMEENRGLPGLILFEG